MSFYDAVIDIGSNSVRLVIYFVEGRSIWPVFNEKVLAGLGRDLSTTRKLSPSGKQEALVTLRRFKAILESYDLNRLHVVATAACRDAEDGADFMQEIYDFTQFEVRILSGEEEAYYSAQGVRCGHLNATGIMGDLGGSSLELIHLNDYSNEAGVSLPLGPFALGAPQSLLIDSTLKQIREILTPYRSKFQHKTFHAVGGAWRNLALIWLKKKLYPLHIIQQFEISSSDALNIAKFIASQSPASLEKVPGIPKRRLDNIGYAALVLQGLIETFNFETLVFSAYGLREGLLFDTLSAERQKSDPLIAGCAAWGSRLGIHEDLGKALSDWANAYYETVINSSIPLPPSRLVSAAAKLSDIGARLHPDHRADLACDLVMRAPIPGQSHYERVFLAATIYTRYSGNAYGLEPLLISRILGEDGLKLATSLGLLLRLGCDLSAKSPVLLKHAKIRFEQNALILSAMSGWDDLLLGEQTRKRARAFASYSGLNLNIINDKFKLSNLM